VFTRLECELNQVHSVIHTPMARAAALTTVDQDIDAAKRLVLSMLTHHNMFVPISILPAGILARIFHVIAFSGEPYSLGWVHVTHVCRRWRQIALDDSTLWTHFSLQNTDWPDGLTPLRNKDWITERLSRARSALLVVELSALMSKDTLSLFLPHISHTRELYLRNLSCLHSKIVHEITIQKAPVLECLELSASNTFPIGIKHHVRHTFFKGPLPKLRVFCISQILFPWSLIPRGQLTRLEVALNKEVLTPEPEVPPHDDLHQLIDLLVNCPALEVLTLKNCLPATPSELSGGQTIHLPRLLRLCLGGSSSRVVHLLKMFKLSSSTTLRLDCTSESTATYNEHVILSILSAHFGDPTPIAFSSFKVKVTMGYLPVRCMLKMVASTSLPASPIPRAEVVQADTDIDTELSLSLSFLHVRDFNVVDMILRRACEVLPLSKLDFLSIFSPISIQPVNWGEVFRHCIEVTTVQVYGHMTDLLQALAPLHPWTGRDGRGAQAQASDDNDNDNDDAPAPMHVPIFPKLTSLLLEKLSFTDAVPDLVMSAVQWRMANKTPLTTLCIDRCAIRKRQAEALEKVVRDFRWDHLLGFHYNEDGDSEDRYDYETDYRYPKYDDYDNSY